MMFHPQQVINAEWTDERQTYMQTLAEIYNCSLIDIAAIGII